MMHFDNGARSKIDDILTAHGVLPYVIPLVLRLKF